MFQNPLEIAAWIFLLCVVVAWFALRHVRNTGLDRHDVHHIKNHWTRIKKMSDKKAAILQADALLDDALKRLGKTGTLGEKLKANAWLFRDSNDVWFAHKLRNRLAHELDAPCTDQEYLRAIKAFESALADIGVR